MTTIEFLLWLTAAALFAICATLYVLGLGQLAAAHRRYY